MGIQQPAELALLDTSFSLSQIHVQGICRNVYKLKWHARFQKCDRHNRADIGRQQPGFSFLLAGEYMIKNSTGTRGLNDSHETGYISLRTRMVKSYRP